MSDNQIRTIDPDGSGDEPEPARTAWRRPNSALVVGLVLSAFALLLYLSQRDESTTPEPMTTLGTTSNIAEEATSSTIQSPGTTQAEVVLPICETVTNQAVAGFFAATANGDAARAEAFFAVNDFGAFEEPPNRTGDDARSRGTLLPYFQARTADGFRMSLVSQYFNGGAGDRFARFSVEARNEKDDALSGTGTVNCQTGKIVTLRILASGDASGDPPMDLLPRQIACVVDYGEAHHLLGPIVGGVGSHTVGIDAHTFVVVTASPTTLTVQVEREIASQTVLVPIETVPASGLLVEGIRIDDEHPAYSVTCWRG